MLASLVTYDNVIASYRCNVLGSQKFSWGKIRFHKVLYIVDTLFMALFLENGKSFITLYVAMAVIMQDQIKAE